MQHVIQHKALIGVSDVWNLPSEQSAFSLSCLLFPNRESVPRRDRSRIDSEATKFRLLRLFCQSTAHGMSRQLWE